MLVLLLGSFVGSGAAGAQQAAAPLWHGLEPGPYPVGFEVQFVVDSARSFYPPGYAPPHRGRPVRLFIWYPGKRDTAASSMRFGDYIDVEPSDARFAAYNDVLRAHDRARLQGQVRAPAGARTHAVAGSPTAAVQNLEPAHGTFPLVLHATGIGSWQPENTVLYEYLTSHGYVVATVPQYGPRFDRPALTYSARGAELQRRDLETALAALLRRPSVDAHRIGLTGHSFGGLVALWLASRNQHIDALASLDGSIMIAGGVEVLDTIDWDPEAVRLPMLTQYTRAQGPRDPRIVNALLHADRYHVIYQQGSHFDFQNWPLHVTGTDDPRALHLRPHEDGRDIYLSVVQLTRHFFDAVLKDSTDSLPYVRGQKRVLRALETTRFDFQPGTEAP